ncbi:MAG: peptide deformylase [Cellulomonadaceae bacterium]
MQRVSDHLDAHPDGVLPIVCAGHPVLRSPAAAYTGQLGSLLPRLLEAMRATMHAAPGVGLAAPQIGLGLALAVAEDAGMGADARGDARERTPLAFRVLVNPRYDPVGEELRSFYEGCLSVPGYQAVATRPRRVRLVAADHRGQDVDEILTGWPARIVQHETDHLRGRLYVDVAEPRSLCENDTYGRLWAQDPAPARAGAALGFRVEGPSEG